MVASLEMSASLNIHARMESACDVEQKGIPCLLAHDLLSQKADILTKGLQAYSHELAREGLRLRLCNGL